MMKNQECANEQLILRAANAGQLNDEMLAHLASCAACQEVLQVSDWMQSLAHVSTEEHPLPQASYVWWKAQLLEQQAAEERAIRPLLITQGFIYIAAVVSMAFVSLWKMPQLLQWFTTLRQPLGQSAPLLNSSGALPLIFIGTGLLCLTVLLLLRSILLED